MSKASRTKGSSGEREVRDVFRSAGLPAVERGGWMQVQQPWVPDVITVEGLHVEVKRQERLSIPAWLRQAEEGAALTKSVPLLAFRQSRQPWRGIVPLDYLAFLVSIKESHDACRK